VACVAFLLDSLCGLHLILGSLDFLDVVLLSFGI
jgi:hypothetical protein